ncbi:MAG TPA: sigma-70 family RNA polymerase sigma factor [archaeon]|nr:sigma-70 family RNA polymerase sigma factor [archaeon]
MPSGKKTGTKKRIINHPEIANKLFHEHQALAIGRARNLWLKHRDFFQRNAIDCDDLEQHALMALHNAAKNYDPSRKVKFSTIAVTYIKNELYTVYSRLSAKKRSSNIAVVSFLKNIGVKNPPRDFLLKGGLMPIVNEVLENSPDKNKERDKLIFLKRFGLIEGEAKTAEELGAEYKMTRQNVNMLVKRIIGRIRAHPEIKKLI